MRNLAGEMEQLDAKDRAAMLKIETKRQHG
jgi:hypothetical protein